MDIYLISIINLIILNLIIIIIKILLHNLYKYKLHIEQLLSLFSSSYFIHLSHPVLHSLKFSMLNIRIFQYYTPYSISHLIGTIGQKIQIDYPFTFTKKNSRKNFYILTLSYKECINCKDGVKNCCYLCHVYYRDPVIHI